MPAGTDEGIDWRSATIYLVVAAAVMGPLDSPLVSPALPTLQAAHSLTDAQVGLVMTTIAVPGIVFAPIVGVLADREGRVRILAACLVGYGLAGGAITFVSSFEAVIALRLLQGVIGSSILTGLAMTLIGDLYAGATRNAAMGVLGGATNVAVAGYPGLGGLLAGVDWRLPFATYFVSVLVGAAVALGLDEPTIERPDAGIGYLREAIGTIPLDRALALYGGAIWSFFLLFGTLTLVPLVLAGDHGYGPGPIGLLLTIGLLSSAAVSLSNGRLAARFSNATIVAAGFVGYGVGLLSMGLAPTPALLAVGLVIFGAGHGLTFPTLATGIAGLADARHRAGAMSLRTSMLLIGQAIGPWLFPVLAGVSSRRVVLLGAGGVSIWLGVATVLGLARYRARAAPS